MKLIIFFLEKPTTVCKKARKAETMNMRQKRTLFSPLMLIPYFSSFLLPLWEGRYFTVLEPVTYLCKMNFTFVSQVYNMKLEKGRTKNCQKFNFCCCG
jgi:hypothetical protein